jgi:hypothetical protein
MGKWLTGGVQNYYTPQVSGLPVEYKIIIRHMYTTYPWRTALYVMGTLLTRGVHAVRHG